MPHFLERVSVIKSYTLLRLKREYLRVDYRGWKTQGKYLADVAAGNLCPVASAIE